ncbi:replication initiation protein, partial [Lacticaseibacillus paracasei]
MAWLGSPSKYQYKYLKNKVLNPAIEEINCKINDMELELLQARRGRKVVQIEIHNNFARRKSLRYQ